MKKVIILMCICLLLAVGSVSADQVESLYTLVVPQQYTTLTVNGCLGSVALSGQTENAAEIIMFFSPFRFNLNLGAGATYEYFKQDQDTTLDIDANGTFSLGTAINGGVANVSGGYTNYALKLEDLPAYYSFGFKQFFLRAEYSTAFDFDLVFSPYASIGVGRTYAIATLRWIELMMKHLGVVPTEANVRQVADLMYSQTEHFSQLTDNDIQLYTDYYTKLAAAFGVPDKVLEIIYMNQSQVYAFEAARYNGLRYGWEGGIELNPEFTYYTSPEFSMGMSINGEYNGSTMDRMLYYKLSGDLELEYDTSLTPAISFLIQLNGHVRYLPEDYHWWVEGDLEVGYNTRTSTFTFNLNGEGNYLMTPNFTLYAGVSLYNRFGGIGLYAGGNYRIW